MYSYIINGLIPPVKFNITCIYSNDHTNFIIKIYRLIYLFDPIVCFLLKYNDKSIIKKI